MLRGKNHGGAFPRQIGRSAYIDFRIQRLAADISNLDDQVAAGPAGRGSCADALEEARGRLDNICFWQTQVREQFSNFEAKSAKFGNLLGDTVRGARALLRDKTSDLHDYHAVQLDSPDSGASAASSPASVCQVANDKGSASAPAQRLMDFRLPEGFVWVPLAQIDLANELRGVRSGADYSKVTHKTMREGMKRLQSEVLPRIHENPGACSSEVFRELDQASGRDYEHGLQRVYEAFFGRQDFIYLVRRKGAERFEVVNGRHRIQVALELGWVAVAAQIKDLNL